MAAARAHRGHRPGVPRRSRRHPASSCTTRRSTSAAPTRTTGSATSPRSSKTSCRAAKVTLRRRRRPRPAQLPGQLRQARQPSSGYRPTWTVRRGVEELYEAYRRSRPRRSRTSKARGSCASQRRAGARRTPGARRHDCAVRTAGVACLPMARAATLPLVRRDRAPIVPLDLGSTPLADALVDPADVGRAGAALPARGRVLPDCSLVQILEEVPPEQLFVDNYLYFSSFSDHLLAHAREHAARPDRARATSGRTASSSSSRATTATCCATSSSAASRCSASTRRPDQAEAADAGRGARRCRVLRRRAGADACAASGKAADVIIANNVMAHVPDLNGFVEGMRILLADDGVDHRREPVRPGPDRPLRVRHDLPRAPLLLLVHRGRRAHAPPRAVPQPRRVLPRPPRRHPALAHRQARGPSAEPRARYLEDERRARARPSSTTTADFAESGRAHREATARAARRICKPRARSIAAYGAAAKGSTLLNYVGHRHRPRRLRRRPQRAQAGPAHARRPPADPAPEALARATARLRAAAGLELRGRDHRPAAAEYARRGGRFIVPVPDAGWSLMSAADGRPADEPRPCPACGVRRLRRASTSSASIPAHSCCSSTTATRRRRFPRGDLRLGFCRSCGFITNAAFDAGAQRLLVALRGDPGLLAALPAVRRGASPSDWVDRYDLARQGRPRDRLRQGRVPRDHVRGRRQPRDRHRPGSYAPNGSRRRGADRIDVPHRTLRREHYDPLGGDAIVCRHTLEHIAAGRATSCARSAGRRSATARTRSCSSSCPTSCACSTRSRSGTSTTSTARTSRRVRWPASSAGAASTSSTSPRLRRPVPRARGPSGGRPRPAVSFALEDDLARTIASVETFKVGYRRDIERRADELRSYRADGKRVVIWGAGSKGVAYLTTLGEIGGIDLAVDVNPHKQGMYLAGTGKRTIAPAELLDVRPDVVIRDEPRVSRRDPGIAGCSGRRCHAGAGLIVIVPRQPMAGARGPHRTAPQRTTGRQSGYSRLRHSSGARGSEWGRHDANTDPGRRLRQQAVRRDRQQAQADGRDRRRTDPVAHHEALRVLRVHATSSSPWATGARS